MKKYKQNPKITVSKELKNKLDILGNKGDTYEEIILKLIQSYQKKRDNGRN